MGARQFVVQEALLMMRSVALRVPSLTPITTIASISSFGGTVSRTFLAPASRCLVHASRVARTPVASTTKSTLLAAWGSLEGSRSALTWMRFPSTEMPPRTARTLPG